MKNYFFAAVMAFIFFTLKNNAPAMDQLTYDEIRWAPTKLKPLLLDNTITTNYCSQEATRFRGCAAAVELFASFLNPAIGLSLNNDEFSLIESDNYKLENSNFKKFQEHQRKKLTQFEKNMNEKSIASLIDTYLALRKLNPSPKPHEVALSLNAFMAVAYDPHKLYAP
ncbi:MAG: hypothetical protein Q7U04_04640, partial [Bacteriovorax sp.]|nr:hypothetical protein [Bacteriovorax sp.]